MAFTSAAAPPATPGTNQPTKASVILLNSTYKQLQPTQHVKILFKTNICTHFTSLFGSVGATNAECPQNLATFGVGTNVKSIPLTSKHHWGGSSNLELPTHIKGKVNRIDLIFVPTPKVAKFCGQLSASAMRIAK